MANKPGEQNVTIKYKPKSLLGPIFQEEFDELADELAVNGLVLDPDYVKHIREYHGGIPVQSIFDSGRIERFLNFADSYKCNTELRQFNVNIVRTWMKKAGVSDRLVPFASMPHGAYLCFDYTAPSKCKITVWNSEVHDEHVEIAPDFAAFLTMLRESTSA